MAGDLIYAFRVMRLPLLDAGGSPIGRIEDLVVVPGRPARHGKPASAPRLVGFVASSQRRRIFVNANRVGELNGDGARLKSWDLDLNPFKPRPGEVLIGTELIDRRIGDEVVSDIGLVSVSDGRSSWWEIDKVRLARKGSLGRRSTYRLVDAEEVPGLFDNPTAMEAEAARLRDFHPTEVAAVIRALAADARVESVQPMGLFRLMARGYDDPYFPLQSAAASLQLQDAHSLSTGVGVTVAVVDTSVDSAHPDLDPRRVVRRSFVGGSRDPGTATAHGTAVAGVIAAAADNGIGIPEAHREKIFALFTRLHGEDEYSGTGIGLSIVRKAASLMGTDVTVESVEGEGSTFSLVLPAAPG